MKSDPRAEYGRRIERWSAEMARADRAHAWIAHARLALAAVIAVLAWQAFVSDRISAFWPLAGLIGFAVIAVVHLGVVKRMERSRRARLLYERGMARLNAAWADAGPDGARFLDGHPFADDLDLFGPGSLFQLLDTARTEIGEETLAAWLAGGAAIDEIRARQLAVAELTPRVDFREDLAVIAAETRVARTGPLDAWAAAPSAGLASVHAAMFAASAIVSASLLAAVLMEQVPWTALLLWILVQLGLSRIYRARIRTALSGIDAAAYDLGLMADLLARLEIEPFESPRLAAVRAALVVEGIPPSRRIAHLRQLVTFLDQATLNMWFKPIAVLLLVREQTAVAIDRWHAAYGGAVARWLRAVGDVEALAALATYAYEHPADPYPALIADGPLFDATALGHPLLDDRVGVRNDVRLGEGHPRALIVSGSNMSGKSTLLRGVGVNVVLALAGGPVRAADLTLSPLAIGSTMRIDDSLQAGHSRFYAEILRIRTIVDLARGSTPLLFLLDEILGGTNSHDRRIGAEAIVRILVATGAIGLVTTHDLALTELASGPGAQMANVHFEDRIENGSMVFDYKMRPGVVERSNALALMRAVGLEV
ncbi:MAG: DNA mismatch repair protein MutS [Acidobacteriota bacterium]